MVALVFLLGLGLGIAIGWRWPPVGLVLGLALLGFGWLGVQDYNDDGPNPASVAAGFGALYASAIVTITSVVVGLWRLARRYRRRSADEASVDRL